MKEVKKEDLTKVAHGVYQKNEKTFYIECSIAGTLHYCNKTRLDKLVAKSGSMDAVGKGYISRAGKATLPKKEKVKVRTKTQIKKAKAEELKSPAGHVTYSQIDEKMFAHASEDSTKCVSPNIARKNAGYCNDCEWWNICKNEGKEWKANTEQAPRLPLASTSVQLMRGNDLTF